jgi:hypothetical protein
MYLGFEGDASALFRTSRPRRAEQRSKGDAPVRSVYQVRTKTPKLVHNVHHGRQLILHSQLATRCHLIASTELQHSLLSRSGTGHWRRQRGQVDAAGEASQGARVRQLSGGRRLGLRHLRRRRPSHREK